MRKGINQNVWKFVYIETYYLGRPSPNSFIKIMFPVSLVKSESNH